MTIIQSLIYGLFFWTFIAIKAFGVTFAAWSWLWVLLPFMPFLGLAIQRLHL